MIKNCIVCNTEFDAKGSSKSCSKVCSKSRHKITCSRNKAKLRDNYKRLMKNRSDEIGLPTHYIDNYGYEFLKENKEVLDALKVIHMMTGRFKGLPEEVVNARINARKTWRDAKKKEPKIRQCKICNSDYTGRGGIKTCSNKCSIELRNLTISKNRERHKGKYIRDKETKRMDYIKRWNKIKAISLEMGITTREARKVKISK